MVSSQLNLSFSKASVPFAKTPRFPALPHFSKNVGSATFDKDTDFDRVIKTGRGKERHSFGSRHRRFDYMSSTDGFVQSGPGPSNYRHQSHFQEKHSTIPNTSKFTFGESREKSDKTYVQDILYKSGFPEKSTPGAGRYEPHKSFGKEAIHFSIRVSPQKTGKRSDGFDKSYFKNQKSLPGPGSYHMQHTIGS